VAAPAAPAAAAARSHDALIAMARVDPPRDAPLAIRTDDVPPFFNEAMAAYSARKYAAAADGLRRVITSEPDDVHANFFLAVSLLMTDDVDEAIDRLRQVIGSGDSPLRRTAGILMAKALIRTGDLNGAERELQEVSDAGGTRATDAANLLRRLRAARAGDGR
jgi:predicted Zn-dependent protease